MGSVGSGHGTKTDFDIKHISPHGADNATCGRNVHGRKTRDTAMARLKSVYTTEARWNADAVVESARHAFCRAQGI